MTYDEISRQVREIMQEVWDNRIDKDRPLAEQIRDMINWKPRWTHDETPLCQWEIDRLNALMHEAEEKNDDFPYSATWGYL